MTLNLKIKDFVLHYVFLHMTYNFSIILNDFGRRQDKKLLKAVCVVSYTILKNILIYSWNPQILIYISSVTFQGILWLASKSPPCSIFLGGKCNLWYSSSQFWQASLSGPQTPGIALDSFSSWRPWRLSVPTDFCIVFCWGLLTL